MNWVMCYLHTARNIYRVIYRHRAKSFYSVKSLNVQGVTCYISTQSTDLLRSNILEHCIFDTATRHTKAINYLDNYDLPITVGERVEICKAI